jgi:Family of unknown function (DUF6325)
MDEPEVHGPIDTTVIEFPEGSSGAETAKALRDLVESGAIRLYDLILISKDAGGDWSLIDLSTPPGGELGELFAFAGARSGLVDAEDAAAIGELIRPGTSAAVLVYENAWAVPFVAAARAEGAELVASARLSAQEIMDALDASEPT